MINSKNKALVLEGGAMRGMFTCGILDVFMENNINFDCAIGVSAGATFGCNIKSKQIGRAIRYNKKYSKDKRYFSLWSLITTGDLFGKDFCYNKLPYELDLFDLETYKNNPLKFYAVASNCVTGKPVYRELKTCDKTDLTFMRGSASMPLVSRVVDFEDLKLLDGGMTDSIPLKYVESLGYTKNVVVLTQPREYKKTPNKFLPLMKIFLRKYPAIVNAMKIRPDVYNSQKDYVFEKENLGEVFVLCPPASLGISRTEKDPKELQRVYDEGRKVALQNLQKLKDFLAI